MKQAVPWRFCFIIGVFYIFGARKFMQELLPLTGRREIKKKESELLRQSKITTQQQKLEHVLLSVFK